MGRRCCHFESSAPVRETFLLHPALGLQCFLDRREAERWQDLYQVTKIGLLPLQKSRGDVDAGDFFGPLLLNGLGLREDPGPGFQLADLPLAGYPSIDFGAVTFESLSVPWAAIPPLHEFEMHGVPNGTQQEHLRCALLSAGPGTANHPPGLLSYHHHPVSKSSGALQFCLMSMRNCDSKSGLGCCPLCCRVPPPMALHLRLQYSLG